MIRLNNVPLPTIFEDRESPIYLRWYYHTATNNQKSGQPDALAIDSLIISSDSSPNIFLTLGIDPQTIRSSVTIDPLHPARFMRLKAVGSPPPE